MQVSDPNNVKIYNLSRGKSLPEWLSDRKKRALIKKDINIRKRIELLQDFAMPDLSNTVKMSKDGYYIMATGIYKPRVRCYEVHNLAMKFERCMDAEIITFEILSTDYTKMVFLQNDRYVEFHSAGGTYHRLRIPKYGRDMKYHYPSCDLYFAAATPEIYRLNLERGQFLNSLQSEATEINRIAINPVHQLLCFGTKEGRVEAWDPRQKTRVGILDVALNCVTDDTQVDGFPSVTSLEYNGELTLGIGTATGQILLFDIRSNKPFYVKDHMYGYPIRDIAFHNNYVLSLDSAVLKIWNKDDGKIFTSIEAGEDTLFNNLCHIPNTGLMFMANESPKIQTYFIPQLGSAPKWCSFLDNLTEELEESMVDTVYDDFKFVTKKDLEELKLTHLIGTEMLRGYMHGFFMDMRLYSKAKALVEPFNYEAYKKRKVREKLEREAESRVQIKNLPQVNRDLALKLMKQKNIQTKKGKEEPDLLKDDRFKAMFENPDFEIDINTEEYRLLNPVLSRLTLAKSKEKKSEAQPKQFELFEDEEGKESDSDSSIWSSADDGEWIEEVKKKHKEIAKEKRAAEEKEGENWQNRVKHYQLKEGKSFSTKVKDVSDKQNRLTLAERIQREKPQKVQYLGSGNREMTFNFKKATLGKKNSAPRPMKRRAPHFRK